MFAIVHEASHVSFDGRPEVVASKRGEHFGMGHVLEIGVVLAGEGFAQCGWDKDCQNPDSTLTARTWPK